MCSPIRLTAMPVKSLYRWLADFASRVLVPGGSLLCYTGQTTWHRDANIFAAHLQPRPLLFMLHDQEHRMRGGETIRVGQRSICSQSVRTVDNAASMIRSRLR